MIGIVAARVWILQRRWRRSLRMAAMSAISLASSRFRVPSLPILTLPTTGGTGAEVTCLAIVFDEERQMKMAIADPNIETFAAIIDPELTLTCPPD